MQRQRLCLVLVTVMLPLSIAESLPLPASASTVALCQSSWLSGRTGSGDGAAGTIYTTLVIGNRATRPCRLSGTPSAQPVQRTVSKSTPIGPLASPMAFPGDGGTVVIKPHKSASVILGIGEASNYPVSSCKPARINGVVVTFHQAGHAVRLLFRLASTRVCTRLASTRISGIMAGTKAP